MPRRFCQCRGCPACGEHPAAHGVLFDANTRSLKCPPCKRTANQRSERERAQRRGSPEQRGYGPEHRKTREQLLTEWRPGQPCAHCGGPMWSTENLDLAHTADRSGYRGLAHAGCNRGNR